MPQFVTHIPASHRPAAPIVARRTTPHDRARTMDAYRRRLAALRARAPDALRDRLRRQLRAAAASIAITE